METTDPRKSEIASYVNVDGVSREEIASLLMLPPDTSMGDYALPCFRFAKALKKAPALIAEELKKDILSRPNPFAEVEAVNGYLNFKFDRAAEAGKVLSDVLKRGAEPCVSITARLISRSRSISGICPRR